MPIEGPCIAKLVNKVLTTKSLSKPSIKDLSSLSATISIRLWPRVVTVSSASSTPMLKTDPLAPYKAFFINPPPTAFEALFNPLT